MFDRNKDDHNSLIPSPTEKDPGQPSHSGNWMKIQQLAKDNAFSPMAVVQEGGRRNAADTPPSSSAPKKSNSDWGCFLFALGVILLVIFGFATHDTSYRDKMTPTELYYDDLRNEQEANENRGYR